MAVFAEPAEILNFSATPVPAQKQIYSDRAYTANETYERIAPLLPQYGITRLASLTSLDKIGIPVWNAITPNARSITICQGKGISEIDAKVSAAMEALERAVAGKPGIETVRGSYRSLVDAGHRVDCLSDLIASGRTDIAPEEPVEWAIGANILTGDPIYLPYDAVILDRTRKNCRFWQSSDGLASGNTFDEAMLHGLLERVERDAYSLWQVSSADMQAACCVDPLSFEDPVIAGMIRKIRDAGLMLKLFDITTKIGIPCFTALLAPEEILDSRHARFLDVTHGSGANPDPMRAAVRAITEAAQSRLTFISGGRDDVDPHIFNQILPEGIRTQLRMHSANVSTALQVPSRTNAPIDHVKTLLMEAGLRQVFAVRLTPEPHPFAVAKIFIPRLEHPEGMRKQRFGPRAIFRSLGL